MRRLALRLGVGAAILIIALTAGVVGFGKAAAPATTAAPAAVRDPLDRLSIVRGGIATPLGGEAIAVAGDMRATVEITTDPGTHYARLLHLQLASGSAPIDDATITVAGHMRTMDHGNFTVLAMPSGSGTYVARLPFPMPGEWELELRVVASSVSGDLVLDFDEFD